MKCYECKKQVSRAIRTEMPVNGDGSVRKFRDVCHDCFPIVMQRKGYAFDGVMWRNCP
jgi:hypothetical protein